MKMNKTKIAKLFTFAMIVGGATAIYLYFSKNKKEQPLPKKKIGKVYLNGIVVTKSSDLNIRKEPNTSSEIIGKLKNGAFVTTSYLEVDGWLQLFDNINFKSLGYVSDQYISIKDNNVIEP